MNITVASGKGGTGKTTFSTNLSWLLSEAKEGIRLLDCDVEEPNSNLFVNAAIEKSEPVEVLKPEWNSAYCKACGKCVEACRYNAMALVKGKVLIFNELCHGCGACTFVCPNGALTEKPVSIGEITSTSDSAELFFAEGRQGVGETLAPAVVRAVQKKADSASINISDAAPGTACPVVEAIGGSDIVVLVTEPTPFGLHDLRLALDLVIDMGISAGIVINRSEGDDAIIANFAEEAGIPVLGRIPFLREYAETYSRGELLVEKFPDLRKLFLSIYDNIKRVAAEPLSAANLKSEILPDDDEKDEFPIGSSKSHKEIVVLSGKGGTGKTTLLGSLAVLADQAVLADGDVDASDLHLLLPPKVRETGEFRGNRKAFIDIDACIGCGACADICHFNAIHEAETEVNQVGFKFTVNQSGCEGCELCPKICPVDAISMKENVNGSWYISRTDQGPMVHAHLGAGEENSGKLVTMVRQKASLLARQLGYKYVLIDGPPGTSCPAIAAVTDVDLAVLVTEPTVAGVHDLERVLELCGHFGIPTQIVINKADLNPDQVRRIRALSEDRNTPILAEIPFDRSVHEALLAGKTPVEHGDGPAAKVIKQIWKQITEGEER